MVLYACTATIYVCFQFRIGNYCNLLSKLVIKVFVFKSSETFRSVDPYAVVRREHGE